MRTRRRGATACPAAAQPAGRRGRGGPAGRPSGWHRCCAGPRCAPAAARRRPRASGSPGPRRPPRRAAPAAPPPSPPCPPAPARPRARSAATRGRPEAAACACCSLDAPPRCVPLDLLLGHRRSAVARCARCQSSATLIIRGAPQQPCTARRPPTRPRPAATARCCPAAGRPPRTAGRTRAGASPAAA